MMIYIMCPCTNEIFVIYTTNEILLSYFARAYCLVNPQEIRAKIIYSINLINNDTELILDQTKIQINNPYQAIILINRFIRNNLTFIDDWNAYHASSIVIGENTYILMGESGAGKTTLVAYLNIVCNATILTEDRTIINCNNCEIRSQNIDLALRKDSINLLSDKYGCDIQNKCIYQNNRFIYTPLDRSEIRKQYSACRCFVLCREPGRKNVEKMVIDSSLIFVKNSYCAQNAESNIKCAQRLFDRIDVYKLYYDDLAMVYKFFNENECK